MGPVIGMTTNRLLFSVVRSITYKLPVWPLLTIHMYLSTVWPNHVMPATVKQSHADTIHARQGKRQQRTGQALLNKCGIVLQMVQCRLLSELSLTSVLSRSITVSSLVGCESVEGGAPPDEEPPVCEWNRQGQRKWTCHYMRLTLQEVTTHRSMWTDRNTGQEGKVVCLGDWAK